MAIRSVHLYQINTMEFIKKCNNISSQQQRTYVWLTKEPLSYCSEEVHGHRELVWWGGGARLCLVGIYHPSWRRGGV